MDVLRRKHAPIAESAWAFIDEQAREVLRATLSARAFVTLDGPHGFAHSAVGEGRLQPAKEEAGDGIFYGIRKVQPLLEVRVPFRLDLWELDNVARGARDPDLDALIAAARKIAQFEERAIYYGFAAAGITGLEKASTHRPLPVPRDPGRLAERVAHAVVQLQDAGEERPYALVAGPALFQLLEGMAGGYPPRKQVEALLGGPVLLSSVLDGGLLVPAKGDDDFVLTLGQDLSLGYEVQEGSAVRLYFTESFTFRVLEPQAVVVLRLEG